MIMKSMSEQHDKSASTVDPVPYPGLDKKSQP